MDRRQFLRAASVSAGTFLTAGEAVADHEEETYPQPADGSEVYESKIRTLRYPLSAVPAVLERNDTLRVELDVDTPGDVTARLEPSFGETETGVDLQRVGDVDTAESRIWSDAEADPETFAVAEFEIPPVTQRGFVPDLYDLSVSWDDGTDHQPRAVSVHRSFPSTPKIAVIADPQIADPRAAETGVEEAGNKQRLEPAVTRTRRTTGDGTDDSRWNATQTAIEEVNLLDPDLVLVAGDLCFGQDAPGKFYAEYEEAWRIFNRIRAPTYTVLGNHDAYIQGGVDGKALYRETFGPFYYSVDIGEDLHLVALDTYDWNELDRLGAGFAVSTYGGQVRDAQYEWLRDDLRPWVEGDRDGSVLALGHHNPSWQWDGDSEPADRTRGTPGAEQFGRGTRFFTTGQAWSGQRHHFDLRALFDQAGVSAFFAGHSHRDRVSRTVPSAGEFADVVETPGPHSPNDGRYHYVEYEDRNGDGRPAGEVIDGWSQDEIADRIREGDGTLYVNCTTTASSTGQYWGWRPLSVDTRTGEVTIDAGEFGYEATESFLRDRAVNPDSWNPDHSEVGLYSHPSYLLDIETVTDTATETAVRIDSDLATPISGAVVLSVDACDGVTVAGGTREWLRGDADGTEVKVAFELPPADTKTVSVRCRPR
ncbi:MAG: metallophosphoesterase family protein [Natronomonas sp.]